jgi:hypothetical protein
MVYLSRLDYEMVCFPGGLLIQIARIETGKAERMMRPLCDHVARKMTA